MKNIKFSAILFSLLTLWQALLARYIISGMSFSQIPIYLAMECTAILGFAVVAIWLLTKQASGLCCPVKQAFVAGGVLYTIFSLMNLPTEMMMVQSGLSSIGEQFMEMPFVIGGIAIKLLLLVAGVVFAVLPDKQPAAQDTVQTQAEVEVLQEAEETAVAESAMVEQNT